MRWVTGAVRLLCHYTRSKSKPTQNLMRLVGVVLNYYLPGWFMYRKRPHIQDGSRNYFFLISLLHDLHPDDQAIARDVLSFNAFWAHPESIVISMLNDEREEVRREVSKDSSCQLFIYCLRSRPIPPNVVCSSVRGFVENSDRVTE